MNWLTFLATNLKSFAWPVAGLIALFVLKRQIAAVGTTPFQRVWLTFWVTPRSSIRPSSRVTLEASTGSNHKALEL
jgi:hypothetical protein